MSREVAPLNTYVVGATNSHPYFAARQRTNRCEFIKHGEIEAGTELGASLALNLDAADSKAKREASSRVGKGNKAKGGAKQGVGVKKKAGETKPAADAVATPPPPPPEDHGKETVHAAESLASFMSDHGMGSYHNSAVKLLTLLGKVKFFITCRVKFNIRGCANRLSRHHLPGLRMASRMGRGWRYFV